jgi:hypothetical protein
VPVTNDSYSVGNLYTAAEVTAVAHAINGSGYLAPVMAATVGTETFTIASGSVTVINGTTLDGQSPAIGERILVKDAPSATGTGSAYSTQPGNGIYSVTNATTNLTIARVYEMGGGDVSYNPAGWIVTVGAGTVNSGESFMVISPTDPNATMTYGTTNVKWDQLGPDTTNAILTTPTVTGYTETINALGTCGSSKTIAALSNGTVVTGTLTASTGCTFTMPTVTAGQSFIFLLKQAVTTGAGTATFTSVKWNSGGAPTQTTTAATMDIYTFVSDGTDWYGSYSQGYTP